MFGSGITIMPHLRLSASSLDASWDSGTLTALQRRAEKYSVDSGGLGLVCPLFFLRFLRFVLEISLTAKIGCFELSLLSVDETRAFFAPNWVGQIFKRSALSHGANRRKNTSGRGICTILPHVRR